MTWDDGTSVEVYLSGRGKRKRRIQIQHRKLATRADVLERRQYWQERLGALTDILGGAAARRSPRRKV